VDTSCGAVLVPIVVADDVDIGGGGGTFGAPLAPLTAADDVLLRTVRVTDAAFWCKLGCLLTAPAAVNVSPPPPRTCNNGSYFL
jgi:hypothetical protein